MSNKEYDPFQSHESLDESALAEHGKERREQLHEQREREAKSAERKAEKQAEARREIESIKHEQERSDQEKHETAPAERPHPTRRDKEANYKATMQEIRSHMSAPSRAFSAVIHNPAVEKASEVLGSTVARPNAILSGAVFAFLFTLVVYLVARLNGYPLSGTESIAAFALGWIVGIIYDFLKAMVTGKH